MKNSEVLIEFKNIKKIYGKGANETFALNGVDLKIHKGEFVAIMGASGSGKSTSMNIIGCLDKPSSGEYLFDSVNVENLNLNQMAILRRNYIGFVFQGFNLLGRTTALENVELPLIYRKVPKEKRYELAVDALKKVGLESVIKHTPAELSGGQQQRVAIARAIVTDPLLLLADEPTGNLDSIKSIEVMELLKKLNEELNITIIMVTHEEEMAAYASRVIYFRDGNIEDSLKKVGLESVIKHTPAELSGGQQQRVAIARAIVTDPLLLLADEPTGNLESIKSIEVMELLKKLNEELNITIIMVTHEEEMAAYASRVIYFRDGNIEESLKKGFK